MEEQYAQVVKALEQELGDRVFLAVTDFHSDLETTIYPFSLTFASRISDTFFIFFFPLPAARRQRQVSNNVSDSFKRNLIRQFLKVLNTLSTGNCKQGSTGNSTRL